MILPKRLYYPLNKAASELGCDEQDLIHFGALGTLEICHYFNATFNVHSGYINVDRITDWDFIYDGVYCRISGGIYDGGPICDFNGIFRLDDSVLSDLDLGGVFSGHHLTVRTPGEKTEERVSVFLADDVLLLKERLFITADEIKRLKEGAVPEPTGHNFEGQIRRFNNNKQMKLIKALIEINYGVGSSEKPRNLLNEDRGTGELLEDFHRMGIAPPVSGSTLAAYLKHVELDYVNIPTLAVGISKK